MKPTVFAAAILSLSGMAGAAVLSGTVTTSGLGTGVNLTTTGTVNWAAWGYSAATEGTSLAPSNYRSGGPTTGQAGYISNVTSAGTSNNTPSASGSSVGLGSDAYVRGGGAGTYQFSYSNGAVAPSSTPTTIGLVFDSSLDLNDEGVKFSVIGDPTQIYRVSIWATGYGSVGSLTASLNGFSNVVLSSQAYATSKDATLFTIDFSPTSAADLLNISYLVKNQDAAASSHVGIQAVTVAVIPEPSFALLSICGLAAFGIRRRR